MVWGLHRYSGVIFPNIIPLPQPPTLEVLPLIRKSLTTHLTRRTGNSHSPSCPLITIAHSKPQPCNRPTAAACLASSSLLSGTQQFLVVHTACSFLWTLSAIQHWIFLAHPNSFLLLLSWNKFYAGPPISKQGRHIEVLPTRKLIARKHSQYPKQRTESIDKKIIL